MKKKFSKFLGVGLALVLVCSFSLVTAVPVAAQEPETLHVFPLELGKTDGAAEWVTAPIFNGSYSAFLYTGVANPGDEARIEITMPPGTTLNDINTVSWWVHAVEGYPPHLDITLDVDGDNEVDDEDMLTAEMAYNNAVDKELDDGLVPTTGEWLQTFELAAGDGYGEIDDSTMLWVTKMGAGNDDAPSGTLAQWKDGIVGNDPGSDGLAAGVIDGSAPLVKLEIEVDRWVVDSRVYVDDIAINGVVYYGLIQDAIDSAIEDDTISVAAGTYSERQELSGSKYPNGAGIIIDKSLTLLGANAGVPATETRGPESIITAPLDPLTDFAVVITGAETIATFDGFTIDNYEVGGILAGSHGLEEEDPSVVHILNNIVWAPSPIEDAHNNCIQVGYGTTGTIIGNEVFGAVLVSPSYSGSGILVSGSSNIEVSNNYVHDNEGGIQIQGWGGPLAENNLIENNLVENCDAGISVQGYSIGTIIRYNDVLNNDTGIGSLAYDFGTWGSEYQIAPSGTEVHSNNIVGSENYGVTSSVWSSLGLGEVLAEEVDATNNWWGDATGPAHASNPHATPLGDAVTGNVDFTPWYATATTTPSTENVSVDHNGPIIAISDTIQGGIDAALADDIINVAAGEYAGAIVDKDVTVSGVEGGASVITSGVEYKAGNPALHSAFRPEANGAEIRNFTVNCDVENDLDLGVYAVGVDGVTVDFLTINNGTIQGITNWNGSGWVITNNVITDTVAIGGGGIGIFLGAKTGEQCAGNLVQLNTIDATATAETYSCAGIAVCLDMRYGGWPLIGNEDVSGNQILDNVIMSAGTENSVGIEIGAILGNSEDDALRTDPDAIAALMAAVAVHDNLVRDNDIDGAEIGIYFYNVTDLTVAQNEVTNSVENGIYVEHGHSGVTVNYNNIYGNACGLENDDTDVDYGSIDASKNYWGDPSGPDGPQSFTEGTYTGVLPGTGNKVSAKVQSMPWLTRPFEEVIEDDIAYFGVSFPALKGWNIVSAPLALDEDVTADGFAANTWGGLLNLGKKAEGDDYALKLHYTVVEDVRVYTPIWYYDSDPDSPDVGWRQATELTEINPVDAFYIRMMESDSFPVLFSPDLSVPSKKLYQGWNLVGCAYMDVMFGEEDGQPLETALATIEEVSSLAGDVTGYSQVVSPPVNQPAWIFIPPETYIPSEVDEGTILMGKGYWVFMENPGTLAGLTFTPISLSGPPVPPPPPEGLTEVSFQWYQVEGSRAIIDSEFGPWDAADDNSFTYTLPWAFPFAGKDIVEIEVTSNGLIELLESGETSDVTDSYDYMMALAGDNPDSDIIFAWNDDLDSGTYGFYGVEYVPARNVVVVHWETETNDDEYETEFIPELNYFQLWLFPDGSIKWNFKEFNYVYYGCDLGTGIYDGSTRTLFNVAHAMGEPDLIFNTPEKSYEISGEYMP